MAVRMPADQLLTGNVHRKARWLLWAALGLDVMAAAWMVSAGDWLDATSR